MKVWKILLFIIVIIYGCNSRKHLYYQTQSHLENIVRDEKKKEKQIVLDSQAIQQFSITGFQKDSAGAHVFFEITVFDTDKVKDSVGLYPVKAIVKGESRKMSHLQKGISKECSIRYQKSEKTDVNEGFVYERVLKDGFSEVIKVEKKKSFSGWVKMGILGVLVIIFTLWGIKRKRWL